MPKQQYTIRSFSGGINTVKDPRDLAESEVSRIDNMSIDAQGKINPLVRLIPTMLILQIRAGLLLQSTFLPVLLV